MFWMYTYLGGAALKTLLTLFSPTARGMSSSAFNEIVLWPLYLVFDVFMFLFSIFGNKD